jgi:hypothetical protein
VCRTAADFMRHERIQFVELGKLVLIGFGRFVQLPVQNVVHVAIHVPKPAALGEELCVSAPPTESGSVVACCLKMNATAITERQTLDVKSCATELGVCEETIRRLVRRKLLRKLPGLRRVGIARTEIQPYMNGGRLS